MEHTKVLRVDSRRPGLGAIRLAADTIRRGGLVAFPTETVYGLGADALNVSAVERLFVAKQRPLDNPPIVHVSGRKDVSKLVKSVPKSAERLMSQFWPGPLTLIFERSEIVPDVTVASLNTVALRMPRNNVALALIKESSCPLAAPSANLAGRPSPTMAEHVLADLDGRIDVILDGGSTMVGVESTVLDLTVNPPQVLRPGGVSFEVLVRAIRDVKLGEFAGGEKVLRDGATRSPGMKYRHYSPNARVIVVEGDIESIKRRVVDLAEAERSIGKRVGILASDETAACYRRFLVKSAGSRSELEEVARNLFRLLREFDAERVDVIVAEGFPTNGLGLAVMNRLRKAAGDGVVRLN